MSAFFLLLLFLLLYNIPIVHSAQNVCYDYKKKKKKKIKKKSKQKKK